MKKAFQIFLFSFAVILSMQANSFACKCEPQPDFGKMFAESDAVIKGEAVIVENFGMEIFALIKVEKSWKGIEEDKVIIKTDTGTCGVEFDVGRTYNLWVDKLDGGFVTVPCRDYGDEQIAFIEDKPTLNLKSSNADFDENLPKVKDTLPLTKTVEKNREKRNESGGLIFLYVVSVLGAVMFVLALIVGYFFWRNRNS